MKGDKKDIPSDLEIAANIAKKIKPLIEGLTMNQFKKCIEQLYGTICSCGQIKFKE